MSPARSKRQPIPHRRSRADIVKAVGVAAGVVAATALVIWLLRPGPSGTAGTGGLMNRQPRASWLVGGGIGVAALASWFIVRGRRSIRSRAKVLVPVALGVVLVASVAVGFVWPGGLLRHAVAPPPVPKTPPATTVARPSTTTIHPTSTVGTSASASVHPTTATTGRSNPATSTTRTLTTPTAGTSNPGTSTTRTLTTPSR
jgi:hypothetical protein